MVSLLPEYSSHADSSPSGIRELSPQRPCSRSTTSATHPSSIKITYSVHKPSHLSPPSLTIPTHPLLPPLPLRQVLAPEFPPHSSMELRRPLLILSCRTLFPFSSNRYDLVLLQEINFSNSRNVKVPGYSAFWTDRTLTLRGPATAGN